MHLAADTCIRLHDHHPMPSPPRPLLTRGQPFKRVPGGNSLSSIAVLPGFLHQRPRVLAAWFCLPFSPPPMRPKFLSLLFDVCFFLSTTTPICKNAPLPQATAFCTKTTPPQPAEKRRVDRSRPFQGPPRSVHTVNAQICVYLALEAKPRLQTMDPRCICWVMYQARYLLPRPMSNP